MTATDPNNDPITYSVGGRYARAFNRDFSLNASTGEITVKSDARIDFEFEQYFAVTITATDPSGGTDTIDVRVNVTNVDEPGVVSLSATMPVVGVPNTATLTDPDGSVSGESWTWSRGNTRTGTFTPIIGANTASYTPVTGDLGKYLKVTVGYTDGQGSGKSASETSYEARTRRLITGLLEVGLTVLAHASEISVPEGYRVYDYHLFRVDGETETVVNRGHQYRMTEEDLGKRLKVKFTFREREFGNTIPETELVFTSDLTDVVRSQPTYLGSNLDEVGEGGDIDRNSIIDTYYVPALAQAFTTGNDQAELGAVRLQMSTTGVVPRVSIYSDDSGSPGTSLHVLANPPSIDPYPIGGVTAEEFTASGVTLEANTKYWVVVEAPGGRITVAGTRSAEQETGWSIDDSAYFKNTEGTWAEQVFATDPPRYWPLLVAFLGEEVLSVPQFETKPLSVSAVENSTDSSQVVATITASQDDNDPLTYSVGGADIAAFNEDFTFSSTDGAIYYRSDATVDYETRPSYTVTVSVTDGEDASGNAEDVPTIDDTVTVTINVTNLDEPGTVSLSAVTPAAARALTATLSDPDGSVSAESWTWSSASTAAGTFTPISGADTAGYTPVAGDVGKYLKATVSYTDGQGSAKSASETSDNAAVANPPPVFLNPPETLTVDENATSGTVGTVTATDPDNETVTYSVGGTDATAFNGDFSLNASTGEITVEPDASIDFETGPSYAIAITATDTASVTATVNVTINVTNIDEAGTVSLSEATPTVGRGFTATLADPDGSVSGASWTWSSASTAAGTFTPISGANAATYTPVTGDLSKYLKATVGYTDGQGSAKSASETSTNATVANPPPDFADASETFTVNENATSGTVGTVTATDVHNDTITYSVGGTGAAAFNEDFSLNASTGEITVRSDASIDFETGPSYSVTITATDPSGGTDTIEVTINVINLDEPGNVSLSAVTPAAARALTATLSDPDGSVSAESWTWSSASTAAGTFTLISGANTANYTPVTGDVGKYLKATVSYTDSLGPGKSASETSDNATVTNPPPVFPNPSETFTVDENATSGTVGTVRATDPDNETVTYSVGGTDVTAFNEDFSLNASTGEITVKSDASIDFEARPSYSVTITATDTASSTATVNVTINVTNADDPGVVSLSEATPAVGRGFTATLADPDGSVSGASWTWSSATTRTGTFTPISGADTAGYTPVAGDVGKYLKATVSYTDSLGPGKSASETSDNAAVANPPPVFLNPPETLTVDENATSGTVGTVTATDPDNETVTYSVGGTDVTAFNEDFSLNASTGAITVKSDASIDFETGPSYAIAITATDTASVTATVNVTINVTNIDEAGTVSLSEATPAVGRGFTATLADPDGSVSGESWTWSSASTAAGTFTPISGANAATYTPVTGDLGKYLKATVSYTDGQGSGKSAEKVSTNAAVANPPPVFANASETFTVDENATSGTVGTVRATDPDNETVTYSVGGTDVTAFNEDFSLNASTGAITVKSDASIDFETGPSYSVTITATDPAGGTDTIDVTINVTNADDPGVVSLSEATPAAGRAITATLADPDGSVSAQSWTWSSATTRTGTFTLISGANTANYTPVTGDVGKYLKATVSYTDGQGSGKSAEKVSTNAAVTNPPPVFANASVTFTVDENATSGTVGTVTATDPDNDILNYSVGGTDAAAFYDDFSLNGSTGAITVKSDASIDYEARSSYSVTITATDPSGGTDTIDVTINVPNADEAGVVNLSAATPAVGKALTATLSDPDGSVSGESWTWSSASTAAGTFTAINGANTASYTPVTGDVGKYLKATVGYTDGQGSGKSAEKVSTNATLANPPPVFADASVTFTIGEHATSGTVGTVTATDPDNEILTYSVGGTDLNGFFHQTQGYFTGFNDNFSLNTATGKTTVKSASNINYENKSSFSVTITATDPSGGTDTIEVTINVINEDDPGVVNLLRLPTVGIPLTATQIDADGYVSAQSWTWSSAPSRTGPFTPINGATDATYTPVNGDQGKWLKATVVYTDRQGPGKSAEKVSFSSTVGNPLPVFAQNTVTFTVNENATSGTVGTVTATDPDSDTLTYSVGGTDVTAFNGDFSLNASTGEITVKSTASIDFETGSSYAVTITATDPWLGTDTIDVTINVTNADEAGAVSLDAATPLVSRALTATLADPDGSVSGESWTWSRGNTRTGTFTLINGANTASYTPVTGDADKYLKATVGYTDGQGSGKSAEKVSDNPTVTDPPPVFAQNMVTFTVNENATSGTVGTVTATDPDGQRACVKCCGNCLQVV